MLWGIAVTRFVPAVLVCAVLALVVGCDVEERRVSLGDPFVERGTALGGASTLATAFAVVGRETNVAPELLATIAYQQTRLHDVAPRFSEAGTEHIGLMALAYGGGRDIHLAAELLGVSTERIAREREWNIRGAAALLKHYARERGQGDDWTGALKRYLGERDAHGVLQHLRSGWRGLDAEGAVLVCSARSFAGVGPGVGKHLSALSMNGATWVPADSSNYRNADRSAVDIDKVVIHTTQGSYEGAISWFQNPDANVSAHYVIRSSDGDTTQMVEDKDVAWHAGRENSRSIGIEHEGYIDEPSVWYTEGMYEASASLTYWLTQEYKIPIDRDHIIGHVEGDGATHTDPGDGWDWEHYMELVESGGLGDFDAELVSVDAPATVASGEVVEVSVVLDNRGKSSWGVNETRLGTQLPANRASEFYLDGEWLSPSRAVGPSAGVRSGETGQFRFSLRVPEVESRTGFEEHFQLVQVNAGGDRWFGPIVALEFDVLPAKLSPDSEGTQVLPSEPPSSPGQVAGRPGDVVGGCQTGATSGQTWFDLLVLFAGCWLLARRKMQAE